MLYLVHNMKNRKLWRMKNCAIVFWNLWGENFLVLGPKSVFLTGVAIQLIIVTNHEAQPTGSPQ